MAFSRAELNAQTAKIAFSELQRFFAAGNVLHVAASLDLVDVGLALAGDEVERVQQWRQETALAPLNDQQALQWLERDELVWALAVAPFVLVQDSANRDPGTGQDGC